MAHTHWQQAANRPQGLCESAQARARSAISSSRGISTQVCSVATEIEIELDVLLHQMTNEKKSSNTIRSYKQQYRKLREYLKKDVSSVSQAMIIQSIDKITENSNSRAALLNIGIVVRKTYEKAVELMEKRRVEGAAEAAQQQ